MKNYFSKDMAPFVGFLFLGQMSWATIPPKATQIEGARVVKDAKNLILKNWKQEGLEVQIEILKGVEDMVVDSGDVKWSIQWSGLKPFSGLMSLPVVITRDGKVIKRIMLAIKTKIFRQVLVPIKSIDRHDLLKKESFVVVKCEIPSSSESFLQDSSLLHNMRATRRLLAQNPVLESFVEEVPLVKKGDQVAIVNKNGSLEISANGIAKTDGHSGDYIPVTNLHTGKTVTAFINTKGQLEISQKGMIQ
ncbi:MAG: flagellar basal body P-ring formation chaperone FlgA [Elusimicrobiota bacterium]